MYENYITLNRKSYISFWIIFFKYLNILFIYNIDNGVLTAS